MYPCEQCGVDGVAHYATAQGKDGRWFNVTLCTACFTDYLGPEAAKQFSFKEPQMSRTTAKSPKAAKPAAKKSTSTVRASTSRFSGKTLRAVAKKNPRNPSAKGKGTGYDSFDIILKKPGIKFEDFIKAGGRLKDLAWDVDHKQVKVS